MPNKLTKDAYLADPCGTLSIPYYKWSKMSVPPEIRIVHQQNFSSGDWLGWEDCCYFRLYHSLKCIPRFPLPKTYRLADAKESDCAGIADLLCLCYGRDMQENEVYSWRLNPVFRPELWLLAWNGSRIAGAALAEFDADTKEGSLEWVQVHPEHRRRGVGAALVSALLERLAGMADFATVSGETDNPTAPEALYRRCGFSGDDLWHILRKSRKI